MAVETTVTYASSVGNGATVAFSLPFYFIDNAHIVITKDGVVQTSGFTITGARVAAGGTVTFAVAPASGVVVGRRRVVPITQPIDTQNNQTIFEDVFDDGMDRRCMVEQQLATGLGRAIQFPEGEELLSSMLPAADERAGHYLLFTDAGEVGLGFGLPTPVTPISSIIAANIAALQAASTLLSLNGIGYATAYATEGDGGGGQFQYVNAIPSGLSVDNGIVFTTATAGIYLVRRFTGPVRGEFYGLSASGANRVANAARLNAALVAHNVLNVPYEHPKGQVTPVEGQITAPTGSVIRWNGGGCDWSLSTTACANLASFYCVGSFTALPLLDTSAVLYDTVMDFVSTPILARDDVIFVYSTNVLQVWNTTSAKTYLKGEAVEVTRASGTDVFLKEPMNDSYNKLYTALGKLNENSLVMSDMVAIGDAISTTYTVYLGHLGRKSDVRNINVKATSAVQAFTVDRSANANLWNINATVKPASGGEDTYAISIQNSHNVHVWGGVATGVWHAWSVGGDSAAYNIINRHVVAHGMTLLHDPESASKVHAADIHGNSQFCGFDACPRMDGLGWGGDECFVTGKTTIYGGSAFGLVAITCHLTEPKSFNHYIAPEVNIIARGFSSSSYGLAFDNNTANGGGRADNIGGKLRFHAKVFYNCIGGGATTQYIIKFLLGLCTANDVEVDLSAAQFIYQGNDGTLGGGVFISGAAATAINIALPKKKSVYFSDSRYFKYLDGSYTVAEANGVGTQAQHTFSFTLNAIVNFDGAVGLGGLSHFLSEPEEATGVTLSAMHLKVEGYSGLAVSVRNTGSAVANIGAGHHSGLGVSVVDFDTFYMTPGPNDGTITHTGVTTYKLATFA